MGDDGKANEEETPLSTRIDHLLTEARLVLPGAQALFGFQLVVVLSEAFENLPAASKMLHALSAGCIALTVILLMALAAYHRIVYGGEDTEEFHRTGSVMVTAATVPLAFGLAGDAYVVVAKIAGSNLVGAAVAGSVLVALLCLWHVYPAWLRHHRRQRKAWAAPRPAE